MTRLWLLDFDGTLVDSEKAIRACYLEVCQEIIPERCEYIENIVIGPTLDESSRMILTGKNLNLLGAFKKRFQQLYDDKIILETPQYPFVDETLNQLQRRGDILCVVTNKRFYPTNKLINYYGWNNLFEWVACIDQYPIAKNKSELINMKDINYNIYSEVYLVGDTISDGFAAQSNNLNFIRANYGYGNNEDWKNIKIFMNINNFDEILSI